MPFEWLLEVHLLPAPFPCEEMLSFLTIVFQSVSKNTYYRFLNDCSFNWSKFLLLLAAKVTSVFSSLTRPERVKVLVLDDSVVTRGRSKAVELLARIYDHVDHKYKCGFTMLTLGWSDGYSFIPVGFNLLSSAKKSNRYQELSEDIDHRTNGFRARKEALRNPCDRNGETVKTDLSVPRQVLYPAQTAEIHAA